MAASDPEQTLTALANRRSPQLSAIDSAVFRTSGNTRRPPQRWDWSTALNFVGRFDLRRKYQRPRASQSMQRSLKSQKIIRSESAYFARDEVSSKLVGFRQLPMKLPAPAAIALEIRLPLFSCPAAEVDCVLFHSAVAPRLLRPAGRTGGSSLLHIGEVRASG